MPKEETLLNWWRHVKSWTRKYFVKSNCQTDRSSEIKSFYVVQKDYWKVIGLQWIAKQNISPLRLYKTAKDKDAKNYRPISNLCAASKIFESDTYENHRDRENKEALQRRPQNFKQKWRTWWTKDIKLQLPVWTSLLLLLTSNCLRQEWERWE